MSERRALHIKKPERDLVGCSTREAWDYDYMELLVKETVTQGADALPFQCSAVVEVCSPTFSCYAPTP